MRTSEGTGNEDCIESQSQGSAFVRPLGMFLLVLVSAGSTLALAGVNLPWAAILGFGVGVEAVVLAAIGQRDEDG